MRPVPALAASAAVLALAPAAHALVIQGYQATVNERFASGFPGTPVANTAPSFTLAGYDLSGVGWRDNDSRFAVTLISPEHFLTAAHVAPAVGTTVSFLGADGVKRSYTVASSSILTYGGNASDLTLGRLTATVDTDHIASYNGLYLGNNPADYQDLPVSLYGANGRIGTNTVELVDEYSLLPFPPATNDNLVDSVVAVTDYDAVTGEAQGEVGDSGGPTFVRLLNNQLALFGVHSAIGANGGGVQFTFDTLPVFTAFTQINSALQSAGYAGWGVYGLNTAFPTNIPEPASAATLAAGAVLGLAATRRRRTGR